jgi:hypothetical protein
VRHTIVITLVCAAGLLACNSEMGLLAQQNDRCEAARASSIAAQTRGKVHARWADAKLADHVRSRRLAAEKADPRTVDEKKLPATMQWFDEFVQFKLRLSRQVTDAARQPLETFLADQESNPAPPVPGAETEPKEAT